MTLNMRILLIKAAAAGLLIIPGLIMVTGPVTPFMGLVNGFLDLAHQPDEYVGVDDMIDSAKVMALSLKDLLGA